MLILNFFTANSHALNSWLSFLILCDFNAKIFSWNCDCTLINTGGSVLALIKYCIFGMWPYTLAVCVMDVYCIMLYLPLTLWGWYNEGFHRLTWYYSKQGYSCSSQFFISYFSHIIVLEKWLNGCTMLYTLLFILMQFAVINPYL